MATEDEFDDVATMMMLTRTAGVDPHRHPLAAAPNHLANDPKAVVAVAVDGWTMTMMARVRQPLAGPLVVEDGMKTPGTTVGIPTTHQGRDLLGVMGTGHEETPSPGMVIVEEEEKVEVVVATETDTINPFEGMDVNAVEVVSIRTGTAMPTESNRRHVPST